MAKKISQNDMVLSWLINQGELTTREAVISLGILSLPKRISELRRAGYPISMRYITTDSGKRYGAYRLMEDM